MTSTAAQTPASVARKRPIPHHAAPSSSYNNGQLPSPSPSPQSIPPCFGPRAPDMIVTPRRGEPDSGVKVRKPHTGMTIRLTPELLARLQKPGPKPSMELILKSAAEGGPVLMVDDVKYNTNAHQMAIGSEVHMVARTELASNSDEAAASGPTPHAKPVPSRTIMSMFASLHRKLIVQQVLTAAKRAEMRARTEGSAQAIKEAKKTNMLIIADKDEMLAAAEAIPVRQSQLPGPAQDSGAGGGQQRSDKKRPRPSSATSTDGAEGGGSLADGSCLRDPLTAWFYDCYNHDDYRGHVSDLHKFLAGIDVSHVMFRYHVKPDGTLDPDRRRFCVKFKTKGGRDLALKRSGEALGAADSWSPETVPVIRGRNETTDNAVSDYLLVLPQGSSVAEVIEDVKKSLPRDLKPALENDPALRRWPSKNGRKNDHPASSAEPAARAARRETLEAYRRDMLRVSLAATVAEARGIGERRNAPGILFVETGETNVRRVATVAAREAARELVTGAHGGATRGRRFQLPSATAGGARAQKRAALEKEPVG